MPIVNGQKTVIGVAQLINKVTDWYSAVKRSASVCLNASHLSLHKVDGLGDAACWTARLSDPSATKNNQKCGLWGWQFWLRLQSVSAIYKVTFVKTLWENFDINLYPTNVENWVSS
jgi:hypothetical protein